MSTRVGRGHALVGALLFLAQLGGVPDRVVPDPAQGGTSLVPGHWDRRLSDGQYDAPPSTVCNSASGACSTAPAGVRPPPGTPSAPFDPLMAP